MEDPDKEKSWDHLIIQMCMKILREESWMPNMYHQLAVIKFGK